ncbi:hypothetical protein Cri9333_1914 [Crinalium epipsammum PCC 9333]|uniref:Uncharacterized protein n=1 Tax=Crinalium epipsammum PCC 9333 TaxID=1173022 RepID=K9VXV7_9CYAN|nr:hypothetical protein [Crinalium epipsammum]AFZ12796.1 hypothetical protein Cri9333_1914 [Crinalium epipsammum PCC 9333]
MLVRQNRNNQSAAPRIEKNLKDFMKSLSDVLLDITALEVNTMVVDQITGNKFIPWQVYRDVYPISRQYLERKGVDESLRDRYLSLRKQLEVEYCLLLTEENPSAIRDTRILTDPSATLDQIETQLPNPLNPGATPTEIRAIQDLLEDGRFLRTLRKIAELKAALDNRNKVLSQKPAEGLEDLDDDLVSDLIYAQTVIQLDGDIINRFNKRLFDSKYQDVILQIHQEGVITGDKQWRGLLEFIVNMVQSMLARPVSFIKLPK